MQLVGQIEKKQTKEIGWLKLKNNNNRSNFFFKELFFLALLHNKEKRKNYNLTP
jgi:hypothetical protein